MTPELKKSILAFEDFLNEPPQYEDKRMVRDYRHAAYGRWSELRDKITAALSPPEPTEGRAANEIMRNALLDIKAAHIPDQPADSSGDELSWVGSHVALIRRLASRALDEVAALRAMPLQDGSTS